MAKDIKRVVTESGFSYPTPSVWRKRKSDLYGQKKRQIPIWICRFIL